MPSQTPSVTSKYTLPDAVPEKIEAPVEVNSIHATSAVPFGTLTPVLVLPSEGANVHDIIRHEILVVTTAGLAGLQARLVKQAAPAGAANGGEAV